MTGHKIKAAAALAAKAHHASSPLRAIIGDVVVTHSDVPIYAIVYKECGFVCVIYNIINTRTNKFMPYTHAHENIVKRTICTAYCSILCYKGSSTFNIKIPTKNANTCWVHDNIYY